VATLGERADPDTQRVAVNGKPLVLDTASVTLAMHKPAGVVVTASDERGRQTVYEALRRTGVPLTPGLRYVGRLDQDTAGLLLLTTDGVLAHRLTHPRYGVEKVYEAMLDRLPAPRDIERLRRGIELSDGVTAPAHIEVLRREPALVRLGLHEGRNRQVRRMFEAAGVRVRQLVRTHVGPIALGKLRPGESRPLTRSELRALRAFVGLEAAGDPTDVAPTVVEKRGRPVSSNAAASRSPGRTPVPRPPRAPSAGTGGPDRRRRP
jgi:23S rRNA pseudouridine2605 synthase